MTRNKDLLVVGNMAKDVVMGDIRFGGCAAVIAVNCRRLGLYTGVMSVIGTDEFSIKYMRFLTRNRIDVRMVRSDLANLPVCEVVSRENSISSSVWNDNGCHPSMEKMPFDAGNINEYEMTHLVSCPPTLARSIAEISTRRLSYEPGPMLTVDPSYFDMEVASKSELIFFNEEEFNIAKRTNSNLVETLVDQKGKKIIVTSGSMGSEVYGLDGGAGGVHFASVPVRRVVDPTGAGDCFKSGFFSAFLRNNDVGKAIRLGSMAGKLCVQQKGGILQNDFIIKINNELNYV